MFPLDLLFFFVFYENAKSSFFLVILFWLGLLPFLFQVHGNICLKVLLLFFLKETSLCLQSQTNKKKKQNAKKTTFFKKVRIYKTFQRFFFFLTCSFFCFTKLFNALFLSHVFILLFPPRYIFQSQNKIT